MKYKTLEEIEKHCVHDTCAFMINFLNKMPYQCQWEWRERLDDDELLYEADFEPRDHGKSELFTLAYPLRKICKNPDIRILVIKSTKAMAMRSISVVKAQLESNQRIKAFYAPYWLTEFGFEDIANDDHATSEGQSTWGADKLYVKRRTISQDPTIEGVGVGGAITGGHYDIIILDDVEDPSRLKTEDAYLDQIDWYTGTILQLREPWTKIIIVGTFKRASGDLYEMVRNNPLYSTTVQAAVLYPKLNDISYERVFKDDRIVGVKNIKPKNVKVLCPEKWNIERLIMDREGAITPGMTDNTWRREKMNDLSAFKERTFKREWFNNRYKLEEIEDIIDGDYIKPFFRAKVGGWDTAHTDKKAAAFSVGETFGIGPRGYYLLPEFFREQCEYPELKRAAVGAYARQRPNVVVIEFKDTGIALAQELAMPVEYGGERISIPIIKYEPDSDKVARAAASTPAWESGLIWLPEDCKLNHQHIGCVSEWLPGWIERHIDFPESTWKDDVDVTSMLINYMQRHYPLHGMKNDLTAITEDTKLRSQSRIIDMQKTLGPSGTSVYVPRTASRVMRLPMSTHRRSIRSLPPGRNAEEDAYE